MEDGVVTLPRCTVLDRTIRIPVLLIEWEDFDPVTDLSNENNPSSTFPSYVPGSPAGLASYLNSTSGAGQYFQDVSGGKSQILFEVFGWIRSGDPGTYLEPRASYLSTNSAGQYICDRRKIHLDALRDAIAHFGLDTTNYDADQNGVMDGSVLVYEGHGGLCSGGNLSYHAGAVILTDPPQMTFKNIKDLVPSTDPNYPLFSGQDLFYEYHNNMPERSSTTGGYYNTATWAHELGHLFLAFPDYYNSRFNLGPWGLSGTHGLIPSHPAAFEKWLFAQWIEPDVLTESGIYTLDANEIPDGQQYDAGPYLYVWYIDGDPNRFITIENRWLDDAGNTTTQWAPHVNRNSGLVITEFDWTRTYWDNAPTQLYRHSPTASSTPTFGTGDSFSKCFSTQCITIDGISAPGPNVTFSLTVE